MKIVRWKVWFLGEGELKSFTSDDANFCVAPDTILGIKGFHDDGTASNFTGYDYYFTADGLNGMIIACDIDVRERNVQADIVSRYENVILKRGIWTDVGTMRMVEDQMAASK